MYNLNIGIPFLKNNEKTTKVLQPGNSMFLGIEKNEDFIRLIEHVSKKSRIPCSVLDSDGNNLHSIGKISVCSNFLQHIKNGSAKCMWHPSRSGSLFHLSRCQCGLHNAILSIPRNENQTVKIILGPFRLSNDPVDPSHLQKVAAKCDFKATRLDEISTELPKLDSEQLENMLEHFSRLLHALSQNGKIDSPGTNEADTCKMNSNTGVNEHFVHIFEQNPVPQFICAVQDGLLIDVNQGFLNTFQISRHDAIGSTLPSIGFLSATEFTKVVEEFLKNDNQLVDFEQPLHGKNGKNLIGLWCAEAIEIGNHDCMLVAFTDITDRKHAENALQESETRYRLLADNSTDIIWTMSLEGKFTYVSPSVTAMTGFTPEEVMQIPFNKYVPHESATHVMKIIAKELATPLEERDPFKKLELQQYAKDGSVIDIEVTASFLLDENEELIGIQGSTRNIRDRKLAEAEKEKLEEQLRQSQKMEAVGRLAGGVAHDFNNLLTSINGYSEMLLTDLGDKNPLFEDVKEIRDAATRAAQLTSQLLAFSRKQVISPKPLDLNVVISDAKKMLTRIIGEDISLVFTPEKELPSIMADRSQMEQILMNLVVNARDAMPHGGTLNINTTSGIYSKAKNNPTKGVEKKLYVDLTITDTGFGMDETTIKSIFEPFFTTKEVGKGTGLGLSTVYGIVHQNEGFIEVESEQNIGTTFHVYLPVCLCKPDEKDVLITEKQLQGTETLLLVEDEFTVRELTKKILLRFGYNVIVAIDPGDAFTICQNEGTHIDLLLTDVIMPKTNGKQLAKRLKELRPELKILYMSGYTKDTIDKHGVLELDVEFLQKPFTMEELGEKVRSVLDGETKTPDTNSFPLSLPQQISDS